VRAPGIFGESFSKPVYITALRMLAGKRLSKAQLAKKLRDRGFSPDVVREAVDECERRKYIDDRTFAQLFVASALEKKPIGPLRLMRDLIKQGIDGGLAREIIAEADSDHDERLERAIRKLEASRPGERFDRLACRLVTQGFTASAVARALRQRAARGLTLEKPEEMP
jgi:regulatory protein